MSALVKEAVTLRLSSARTPITKYEAFIKRADTDNRIRGNLLYHAATTGRWASTGINFQNLPRPEFKNTDKCIELFEHRDAELLEMIYDEPMEALSSCLRGMICAPEGKRLIVADFSAIEARVLAWLAGQSDVIEVFESHGKLYEHTASQIYRTHIDAVTSEQRFIGKVATLALGFQGGAKAFQSMAEIYGVSIPTDLAEKIKNDWRKANSKIVNYWWNIESAAVDAVKNPGKTYTVRSVKFRMINDFLYCRLPSGRCLAYHKPRLEPGKFKNEQITFMGTNSTTRKWERQHTYGGKLVENITQAVARDLVAQAMLRIEKSGYEVVLSIHDEILAERTIGEGSLGDFIDLMCDTPEWAEGLPIDAEGFETRRFKKT